MPLPSKATLTERPKRGRGIIVKSEDCSRRVLSFGTAGVCNASSGGVIGPSSAIETSGSFNMPVVPAEKSREIGAMVVGERGR